MDAKSGGAELVYQLNVALVADEVGAGRHTVATVFTVAFCFYLVIIVQTLTT